MTAGSLFLHPSDALADCPTARVIEVLRGVGLAGDALPNRSNAFLAGPRFLDLITFMGCSPYVEMEPPADGGTAFCHLRVHAWPTPRLLTGDNTRPPRCPSCRKPFDRTVETIAALAADDLQTLLRCPYCEKQTPLNGLRWRQDGGLGKLFVEVHNVFPGEAVPVATLLRKLAAACGGAWEYFYLRSDNGGA